MADDVLRHLNYEPIAARPPNRLYRFQKVVRRNKLPFTAAGVVAMALVLGVVVSSWEAMRAKKGELAARQEAYAADMNLAQQALAMNDLGRAKRLLDGHRPRAGEPDLRGWEWR